MQNNFVKICKATIIDIIVALLFAGIIILVINLVAGKQINSVISLINMISVEEKEESQEEIVLSQEKKRLENYPAYGSKYGRVEIESLKIDLPLYHGDTDEILNKGVGHYAGSYFPGEGGSIVCAAHNFARFFRKLPQIKVGASITITTDYGEFRYQVYDTQVIHMSESEKIPIQDEKEILMLYTCYPVTGIGHKKHRFVAYAELVEEKSK